MHLFSALALLCLLPFIALAAEDYYKLLGLDRNADDRQIKKAYRTLSKKYHPDKNPDNAEAQQMFVEVAEAYETLIDEELRRIYDRYGREAVEKHRAGGGRGGGGQNPFDLFSRFFGGGGHFGSGQRRGQNMEVRVNLPLRDFYTGATHEFRIEKQIICDKCEGSGSADGVRETCRQCNGQGAVIKKHMLAPGIYQQVQMQCDVCAGQGSTVKHKCKACDGERVRRAQEMFELFVEPGMARGGHVVFENEGDESPDWVAGDLIMHVMEAEPVLGEAEKDRTDGTFFRRKDRDLFWREVLSLREAWMGDWTRNLTHLDGHVVRLSRQRGQVVQPGEVETLAGEGMPLLPQPEEGKGPTHGVLQVEYVVILPDQMESGMEKDFHATWEKWRKKTGVSLQQDSGRPEKLHDEL